MKRGKRRNKVEKVKKDGNVEKNGGGKRREEEGGKVENNEK